LETPVERVGEDGLNAHLQSDVEEVEFRFFARLRRLAEIFLIAGLKRLRLLGT
jgi:hypothetical protein